MTSTLVFKDIDKYTENIIMVVAVLGLSTTWRVQPSYVLIKLCS